MTEKKVIVVVGATGVQGSSVVNTFLSESSWTVRALTRSSSSSKAQALQAKGAEVFEADLNDVASLVKAFHGAHAIFGVTDFWTLYADQSLRARLKPGQKMNELAFELERQQGMNIFDAAAKVPTLERLVYSTLPHVKTLSNGKYKEALHFDAKAEGAEYGQKAHSELWSKTSLLQVGFYLSNYILQPFVKPSKNQETGVYEFKGIDPDHPYPFVAAENDTGVFVKALIDSVPGKNLAAYRERMSTKQFTELWGQFLGVSAAVVPGGFNQVPAELQQEMEDTFAWAKEYGMFGEKVDSSITTPSEIEIPASLGSVEEWIKAQDWSSVVEA